MSAHSGESSSAVWSSLPTSASSIVPSVVENAVPMADNEAVTAVIALGIPVRPEMPSTVSSMLAASVSGSTAAAAGRLVAAFTRSFAGPDEGLVEPALAGAAELQGLRALLAMRRFATRARCVLLPWDTFKQMLEEAS